ncbi:MAG TPA: Uma2 family endonuclease [Chloroflexia bacterium]|jgi:Uma2 family endonuclease
MTLQLERTVGVKRHLFSLEEYERMCEAGVFEPDANLELIRGEIIEMTPPGPPHAASVARLTRLFVRSVGDNALVWPQGNPIGLPQSKSMPQPDIALLQPRDDYYVSKRPFPEDVILLVEVSESTLKFDRGDKLKLYAEARIPEYWVINLVEEVVEVYTDPSEGKYGSVRIIKRGEMLQLPGGLEGNIAVNDILGKAEEI